MSNAFLMEWPPRYRRVQAFAEIDRAAWIGLDVARRKIRKGQVEILDRLVELQTRKRPLALSGKFCIGGQSWTIWRS